MCEPCHSIIQYNSRDDQNDDDNLPFGGQMDRESRLKAVMGKLGDWGKKVLGWFHLSKLGAGHHSIFTGPQTLVLPRETKYEGRWWERKVVIDGRFYGNPLDQEEALRAATMYSHDVVMDSMSKFRRFLEISMGKSAGYGYMYATRFMEEVLTPAGRDQLLERLKTIFGHRGTKSQMITELFGGSAWPSVAMTDPVPVPQERRAQAIKCLMGYTRRRGIFVPLWADDDKLWGGT